MAQSSSAPGLISQLVRFALIGGFCALVDFGTYKLCRGLGMDTALLVDLARAISFLVGTTTAYFLNRRFTFSAGYRRGAGQIGGFIALYSVTFVLAVGVNQWMLHVFPVSAYQEDFAWLISQATATIINFVMLRLVVFRAKPQIADPAIEAGG